MGLIALWLLTGLITTPGTWSSVIAQQRSTVITVGTGGEVLDIVAGSRTARMPPNPSPLRLVADVISLTDSGWPQGYLHSPHPALT